MSSPSHDAILQSAGRLFGERGYRAVTVRDIAADAGVSAALVMKLFISKEKLLRRRAAGRVAARRAGRPDVGTRQRPRVPRADAPGTRHAGAVGHAFRSPCWTPPTPKLRGQTSANATSPAIARLIGDTTPDRRFASTVTALMTGFGETVRTLDLFDGWDFDDLVAHYGAIVQAQIDACAACP